MTNNIALSTLDAAEFRGSPGAQHPAANDRSATGPALAKQITRDASKQTYYTIKLLADRSYAGAAFHAYAYFRWVDDILDDQLATQTERLVFLQRQQMIVEQCTRGASPADLCPEEQLVSELIGSDPRQESGIALYIKQMMAVMAFDVDRKGRLISAVELDNYTRCLATAVSEALHYCIGHDDYAPQSEARIYAVSAAHITHMLRDAIEDTANGYYNVPRDYLQQHGISAQDVAAPAYRAWVKSRVQLARDLFRKGRAHIAQVENVRCRLAGYAYIARFEVVLDSIEADGYRLRDAYPERKGKRALVKMAVSAFSQVFDPFPGQPARSTSGSRIIKVTS